MRRHQTPDYLRMLPPSQRRKVDMTQTIRVPDDTRDQLSPTFLSAVESPGFLGQLKRADIVIGHAASNHKDESIFFGRALMERVARNKVVREVVILRMVVDFADDCLDPECLAALCQVHKGSCCYRGKGEAGDKPDVIVAECN